MRLITSKRQFSYNYNEFLSKINIFKKGTVYCRSASIYKWKIFGHSRIGMIKEEMLNIFQFERVTLCPVENSFVKVRALDISWCKALELVYEVIVKFKDVVCRLIAFAYGRCFTIFNCDRFPTFFPLIMKYPDFSSIWLFSQSWKTQILSIYNLKWYYDIMLKLHEDSGNVLNFSPQYSLTISMFFPQNLWSILSRTKSGNNSDSSQNNFLI